MKLPKLLAWVLIGLGMVLFAAYWIYLVAPQFFAMQQPDPGLTLYALASAGSAFVAWGWILQCLGVGGVGRAVILRGSAAGFGLLGLMRLGTALFPHAPFDQFVVLPVIEFIVFMLVAIRLYKLA